MACWLSFMYNFYPINNNETLFCSYLKIAVYRPNIFPCTCPHPSFSIPMLYSQYFHVFEVCDGFVCDTRDLIAVQLAEKKQ